MKRLLSFVLFFITVSAFAGPNGHYGPHFQHQHQHHGRNNWNWIAPAVIGGVITYAITRPPVIVQQPPVVQTVSGDIVYIDGIAYRKQWVQVNGYLQEVLVRL